MTGQGMTGLDRLREAAENARDAYAAMLAPPVAGAPGIETHLRSVATYQGAFNPQVAKALLVAADAVRRFGEEVPEVDPATEHSMLMDAYYALRDAGLLGEDA